ncbi:MAG: hypothetical protein R2822_05465 [Spirosomataceae bacterium]
MALAVNDWIRTENRYNQYYVFNAFAEYKLPLPVSHNLTAIVGFNQERGPTDTLVRKPVRLFLIMCLKPKCHNRSATNFLGLSPMLCVERSIVSRITTKKNTYWK